MGLYTPTTQEIANQNVARLEAALGQTSPLADKAFVRVLAVIEAIASTGLYKLAAERAKQNLAQTATADNLDVLGAEVDTYRKASEAARLTVTLPATTGIIIPASAGFTGMANGVRYYIDASAESYAGVVTLQLTAEVPGTVGNLQVGDLLTIISPVAGAQSVATVTIVTNTGAEDETDAAYRPRVLFAMRATTGGGNATDHKIWAELVAGVYRAFPYAGKPVGGGTSYPGDRTVYVESDTTINADGIPTVGLLAEVRAAINIDPLTGLSRSVLGQVDSTLYVEPVIRTSVAVIITNLVTPSGQEATVKAAILAAMTAYMLAVVPYVEGVDLEYERNDTLTTPAVSEVVQSVINNMGSSASIVVFEIDSTGYDTYTLAPGELAKLSGITYVTV